MSRGYYENEDPTNEPYGSHDEGISDTDVSSIRDDEENEYLYQIANDPIIYSDIKVRPVVSKKLKLGDAVLDVSSVGKVRTSPSLFCATDGDVLGGTPFRTVTLQYGYGEYRTYLVHELVWLAFQGVPPPGWVVRHKSEYTQLCRKGSYSNAFHNLTLVPASITRITNDQRL